MRMHLRGALAASLLCAGLTTPSLSAQDASAVLRENDILPSVGPAAAVTSISQVAVNGVGGWAATIGTDDGVNDLDHVWGSANGIAPASALQTNAVIGTLDQTSFETFFGIDDAGVPGYSAICTDSSTATTGLDSAWFGNALHAIEDQPIPALPGKVWRFASRVGTTTNGIPYWVGGINDASGTVEGNGLFFNGTPLLKTGDLVPGLPGVLDGSAVDFDYRFSALGTHWITPVDVVTGSSLDDGHVLLDGAPIATATGTIAEAQPLPENLGGLAGENWDNFDYFSITESGEYLMTGDTDAVVGLDEFVSRNGVIIYREGDVIDGVTLSGSIDGAYMNEKGDIAYVWDANDGSGAVESLFLNGKRLLSVGDAIDLDGDGVIDPGAILSDFTGINSVVIGEDKVIYVTADVDTLGTSSLTDDTEVVLRVADASCGSVRRYGVGCAGTGGFVPQLELAGCSRAGGAVSLNISNALGGSSAVLLLGLGRGFAPLSAKCSLLLSGVLPGVISLPLGGSPGVGGAGSIAAPVVIPPGTPAVSFTMQAVIVDPANLFGGATTNALEVEIAP